MPAPGDPAAQRLIGLDVVRAVAISLVLLSHASDMFASWLGVAPLLPLASLGFYGVELFFMLSGVLIGRLLLDIADTGATWRAWRVFLIRRWMRTLPMYFVWLAILCVVWPPRFWEPGHRALLWETLPWFATLTQNLAWPIVGHGWFGVSWSLTIEEWFYLLFGSLALGACTQLGRRIGFVVATAAFLILPSIARWFAPAQADWDQSVRHVVIFRLDAIAFGILVALLQRVRPSDIRLQWGLFVAGLATLAGMGTGAVSFVLSPRAQQTFLLDAVLAAFACCMPLAANVRRLPRLPTRLARALSLPSYSLYLVHLSILEIIGYWRTLYGLPAWACIAASPPLIAAVALVGYRFIERPFIALRPSQHVASGSVRQPAATDALHGGAAPDLAGSRGGP